KSFYRVLRAIYKLLHQDAARNCHTPFVMFLREKRFSVLNYRVAVRAKLNARAACAADWFQHHWEAQLLCCFQRLPRTPGQTKSWDANCCSLQQQALCMLVATCPN